MIEPAAHRLPRPLPPPIAFAAVTLGLAVLVAIAAHAIASSAVWQIAVPPVVFMAAMALAGGRMRVSYPHVTLGACNAVTQGRAAMVAVLAMPVLMPDIMATWRIEMFVVALTALALDGVDGWLARRAGLSSAFGARFDMEVDSALAAILACLLLGVADGPVHVAALLVLGFARYGFVAMARIAPWLDAPLPDRRSRKAVCVVQIGALIAVLAVPPFAPVLPFAAAAVLWSFGHDILWLARRAP
ncbi:MAG: CDP-alcohol phosphatidyltransferase family protein [Pseudomonadota bacterium]